MSAKDFDEILTLKVTGKLQAEIALITGLSQAQVSRVVRGEAVRPGICSRCGGPVRPENKTGICHSNPECDKAAHHAAYMASTEGIIRTKTCSVCGRSMKMNAKYGVCNRKDNPACVKAHNAARHAAHPEHNKQVAARRASPGIWCLKQIGYLRTHGWLMDLDVPYLLEQWGDGHCPVCGITYIVGEKGGRATSPSMDRVFKNRGYRKGNVRIICMKCNRRKNDMSGAELMALAQDTLRAEAWADSWLTPTLTAS